MFVPPPACVCEELFLSVYTVVKSVTNREVVVYMILYICKEQTRLVILRRKKEKKRENSCDIARQPGCK